MRYLALLAVVAALASGQSYRCDWSVVGMGGGEMSSGAFKCVATAGQTAMGFMTSPDYWALVGFWLPEGQTGVQEADKWSSGQVLATRLYSPFPTPFSRSITIRYSLCAASRVDLRVHDLTGRVVRTLVASGVKRGAYTVTWDGRDADGRGLANGVYFLKLSAGDCRQTEKLVLQR